jgi:hypothetical protein
MKAHQPNYMALLTIITLLVISTGLLNSKKNLKADTLSAAVVTNPLDELSLDTAYASLQHLFASRSIATIVSMMQGVSLERTLELAQLTLSSKSIALTNNDKAIIMLGLAHNYQGDIKKQYQVLDLLKQFRIAKKDIPLLISAVHSEYSTLIPVMLAWMKDKKLDEVSIDNAFVYTIQRGDITGFTKLIKHGVPISAVQATTLLFSVISQKKMPEFIPLLIELGADVDYVDRGHTLLMRAVLANDKPLVEALLKAGADKNINKIVSPSIGSALQLAIEKEYTALDLLLREYGARE